MSCFMLRFAEPTLPGWGREVAMGTQTFTLIRAEGARQGSPRQFVSSYTCTQTRKQR